MRLKKFTSGLDQLGMTASILCALHCGLIPLMLMASPFAGLAFLMHPWTDTVMIAVGLLIGGVSLGISYARHHRRVLPLLLLIAGFAVIGAVHLTHAHPIMGSPYSRIADMAFLQGYHPVHTLREMILLFAGGFCVAAGHLVNWRYNHRHCRGNETKSHIGLRQTPSS